MLRPLKYLLALGFLGVLRCTELLITWFSRDGRTPVHDLAGVAWSDALEANAGAIRVELLPLLRRKEDIPNFQDVSEPQRVLTQDAGWKTFFLYITGQPIRDNCARCPRTAAAVHGVPGMQNALFSILAPGKHIPEHRGVYKGLLRYHLALVVPREREKVRINIDHRPYWWTEGRGLLFDDTYPHEVWNETPEYRVILMVDIIRPLPAPLRLLNRFVLQVLSRTSIARRPLEKLNRKADVELPQPAKNAT